MAGQFGSADGLLPGNGFDIWGLSRYAYVEGNPIIRTDPTGHATACDCGASGGTAGPNPVHHKKASPDWWKQAWDWAGQHKAAIIAGVVVAVVVVGVVACVATVACGVALAAAATTAYEAAFAACVAACGAIGTVGALTAAAASGEPGPSVPEGLGIAGPRAAVLQDLLPAGSKGRVTLGVGIGRDTTGALKTVIGTSEPGGYLRAPVAAAIREGEEIADGTSHAEQNIVAYMRENAITALEVGAGRPICPICAELIEQAGGGFGSPLR